MLSTVLDLSSIEVWPPRESFSSLFYSSSRRRTYHDCKYILSKSSLGTGSYATVYECKRVGDGYKNRSQHFAIKKIEKRKMYGREFVVQNEFRILKFISSLSSSSLIKLVDYFETDENLYLVTQLCKGGELFDLILSHNKLNERNTRVIVKSILNSVLVLHHNNIIHRDLKSENILFSSNLQNLSDILIVDFGFSMIYDKKQGTNENGGTLSYMAPELIDKTIGKQSFAIDVWSIGVLTYFCLCGYFPFDCENDDETKEAILTSDYYFEPIEYWNHISNDAKNFINQCFIIDPLKRPSVEALLNHPFIS
ncbi:serine/threonine-protein kinase, partial [Ascoidea rubescens DSM 1968]